MSTYLWTTVYAVISGISSLIRSNTFNSRYMGTITGISDLDSVRWPNSHWRSVKVYFGPVLLLFPLLTIQALVNHVCCKFSVEKTILQYSLKVCSLRYLLHGFVWSQNLHVNEYRLAGMNQLLVRDSQGCHYGRLSHWQLSQCIHLLFRSGSSVHGQQACLLCMVWGAVMFS